MIKLLKYYKCLNGSLSWWFVGLIIFLFNRYYYCINNVIVMFVYENKWKNSYR